MYRHCCLLRCSTPSFSRLMMVRVPKASLPGVHRVQALRGRAGHLAHEGVHVVGVLGFCEARTPVTRKRGRLRGRDPARWKEGAILRFPIGRARPRPQQKAENWAAASGGCRIFSLLLGPPPAGELGETPGAAAPPGAEGRFQILLEETLTRTSPLPALNCSVGELVLDWSNASACACERSAHLQLRESV